MDFLSYVNETFEGFGEILLQTKARFLALLNLSIIHWSLGKDKAHEQSTCSELNPVQSTRSKSTTFPKKGSRTAQLLQMEASKSLEMV